MLSNIIVMWFCVHSSGAADALILEGVNYFWVKNVVGHGEQICTVMHAGSGTLNIGARKCNTCKFPSIL